jgi:aminopeptidase
MVDERISKLAKILVEHSTKVKKGDLVVINGDTVAEPLVKEVYRLCLLKGAYPAVHLSLPGMAHTYYKYANDDQLARFPEVAMFEAKKADVFINIHGDMNTRELSSIDPGRIATRGKVVRPISDVRMKKRWVGCDYPTNALAMEAEMSYEEYENWFYDACNVDYVAMKKRNQKLTDLLNKSSEVRIVSKNTDLTLSIKGMTAENRPGQYNVPDGEVFTAPEKFKVNGHIEFSYPAIRGGNEVDGIYVEFKNGKVVKATAKKNEKFLHAMLKMDEGSCYIGELGIGVNYSIDRYTKNLLFDEKIGGTIHLAFGMAYDECVVKNKANGNKSALHWDIVKDLRQDGKIFVDGKLVQKNGKFLI